MMFRLLEKAFANQKIKSRHTLAAFFQNLFPQQKRRIIFDLGNLKQYNNISITILYDNQYNNIVLIAP